LRRDIFQKGQRTGQFSKKDNGRGTATLLTLANEKTTFLENISTKNDAARRYFSKRTTDGAPI